MAEVAVHFTLATLPYDYMMMTIDIPGDVAIKEVLGNELPPDWKKFPHPVSTQRFGDEFIFANEFALLRVPSVVTKGDHNILINPNHKDFKRIAIESAEPFPFDERIFR